MDLDQQRIHMETELQENKWSKRLRELKTTLYVPGHNFSGKWTKVLLILQLTEKRKKLTN